MADLSSRLWIEPISSVKRRKIETTGNLAETVLIQGTSGFKAVLQHETTHVALRHRIVHTCRMPGQEPPGDLL